MRSRRVASTANLRDNLPSIDDLPRRHVQGTAMSIARVSVNGGVINQNLVAVAVAEIVRYDDLSVEERTDIRTVIVTEVNARMKFPRARNRMNSPTKRTCHGEFNRLRGRGQNQNHQH